MRRLYATLLGGLVLALGLPTIASAGPLTDGCYGAPVAACVADGKESGVCYSRSYLEAGAFALLAAVEVFGSNIAYCGGSYNAISVYACTVGGCSAASWYSNSDGSSSNCGTLVGTPVANENLGCPAGGPPAVDWGSLLP